jgi:hypothetical protein
VIVLSFAILAWKVKITPPATFSKTQTALEKFTRIDWAGSFTLVICVGSLLLALSLKTTEEYPWDHPVVATLLAGSVVFAMLFFLAEKHWAVEPVMPLRLLVQRTPLFVSLTSLYALSLIFLLHLTHIRSSQLYVHASFRDYLQYPTSESSLLWLHIYDD